MRIQERNIGRQGRCSGEKEIEIISIKEVVKGSQDDQGNN